MAGIRLLVVDDEPEIVAILCEMLGEHGYVVDAARTAEQAIALIREHIYEVALIDSIFPTWTA
jgi:CheY-like chemotaxis protein